MKEHNNTNIAKNTLMLLSDFYTSHIKFACIYLYTLIFLYVLPYRNTLYGNVMSDSSMLIINPIHHAEEVLL
jgi:hypothetical protein